MYENYVDYLKRLNNTLSRNGLNLGVDLDVSKDAIYEQVGVMESFFFVNNLLKMSGSINVFRDSYIQSSMSYLRQKMMDEYQEVWNSELEGLTEQPENAGRVEKEVKQISIEDIKSFTEGVGLVPSTNEGVDSHGQYCFNLNDGVNGTEPQVEYSNGLGVFSSGQLELDIEDDEDDDEYEYEEEPEYDEDLEDDEDGLEFEYDDDSEEYEYEEESDEDFEYEEESDDDFEYEEESNEESEDDFEYEEESDEDFEYEEESNDDFDYEEESDDDLEYEEESDEDDFDYDEEPDEDFEYEEESEDDFDYEEESEDDFDYEEEPDDLDYEEESEDDFDYEEEDNFEDSGYEEEDDDFGYEEEDDLGIDDFIPKEHHTPTKVTLPNETSTKVQNLHQQPDSMANSLVEGVNKLFGAGRKYFYNDGGKKK